MEIFAVFWSDHIELKRKTPASLPGSKIKSSNEYQLHLNLYINSAGKFQFHQGINRLGAVGIDIHQALVSAKLELLTRLLVHVRRTQYSKLLALCRERNRSAYNRTGCFHGPYNFLR